METLIQCGAGAPARESFRRNLCHCATVFIRVDV